MRGRRHLEVTGDPCQPLLVMNSRGRRCLNAQVPAPFCLLPRQGCWLREDPVREGQRNQHQRPVSQDPARADRRQADALIVTRTTGWHAASATGGHCPRIEGQGAALRATEQLDRYQHGWKAGKAFLDMLGVFAEFGDQPAQGTADESGIAKAKAAGVYKGRPPSADSAKVQQLKAEGWDPSDRPQARHWSRGRFIGSLEGHRC